MSRIDARPGEVTGDGGTAVAEAPATPEAVPGGGEVKTKKGPPKKDPHPLVVAGTKLEAVPDDFDPKVHAALKEEDFHENHVDKYYDLRSANLQRQADKYKSKAESFRRLGAFADKQTAKKVADHMDEMRSLLAKLAAQGEDVSQFGDVIELLNGKKEDAPAEAAA